MKKHLIVAISLFLILCSCGTGMKVKSTELKPITKEYSGAVLDKANHFQGRNLRNYFSDSLHSLFNIRQANVDTVFLSFISAQQLKLSLKGISEQRECLFNGKFSKKGYFEIYLSRKNVQIPPLLPIFFSKRRINRIRIALTKEGDIILDHRWVFEGNFLVVGSSDRCRGQYFFDSLSIR